MFLDEYIMTIQPAVIISNPGTFIGNRPNFIGPARPLPLNPFKVQTSVVKVRKAGCCVPLYPFKIPISELDREEAATKTKTDEEAAAQKKTDEEAAVQKKKKKTDEEASAKKKTDEEAAAKKKKKKTDEEAAAKKKTDEEAAAKKKTDEEAAAKKKTDEEAAAKKKTDEDNAPTVKQNVIDAVCHFIMSSMTAFHHPKDERKKSPIYYLDPNQVSEYLHQYFEFQGVVTKVIHI